VPAELLGFVWLTEQDLDPARRDTLLAAVRGIPRPPRSMQQLLSPEFVAKAGSADLAELVTGEPLIAAKVLSTVNGPFYGLHKPVTSIGQSVTFLGINTVRSICLQYMLAEAFKPKLAEAQRCFDTIWRSSSIASELCVRLGKSLNLTDQGSLSTKVVLSFVGQLATASLIPASGLEKWLRCDRLERARLEQELLGLNACEIGCLLMKSWELPADLVNEVGDLGRQLINPYMTTDPVRAPRLALGYLCARLGERLALGQLGTLEGYDVKQDADVDTFHLRAALAHPALARLDQALASPEVQTAVQQMMGKQAA
jgi:HD-like signal output (HDOD) protein